MHNIHRKNIETYRNDDAFYLAGYCDLTDVLRDVNYEDSQKMETNQWIATMLWLGFYVYLIKLITNWWWAKLNPDQEVLSDLAQDTDLETELDPKHEDTSTDVVIQNQHKILKRQNEIIAILNEKRRKTNRADQLRSQFMNVPLTERIYIS